MANSDTTLDLVFSALAHPVRRAMLERLAAGPVSVGELGAPHQMSAPAITKHLNVLERAGLVHRTAEGRIRRVHLDPEPLVPANAWLERHARFWEHSLDRLTVLVEQSTSARAPGDPAPTKED